MYVKSLHLVSYLSREGQQDGHGAYVNVSGLLTRLTEVWV